MPFFRWLLRQRAYLNCLHSVLSSGWDEWPGSPLSRWSGFPWGPLAWVVLVLLLGESPRLLLGELIPFDCPPRRLIKGDGEVLEEIVTKERHREINKVGVTTLPMLCPHGIYAQYLMFLSCLLSQQATRGDGLAFQMRAGLLP